MYKCTDCQAVYKEKVEYCECGNNVFDEIFKQEISFENTKSKKSFDETHPRINKIKNSLDILSVSIFILCLILSACALIFIGRDEKPSNPQKQSQTKLIKTENIPDIDRIWNNTPVKNTGFSNETILAPLKPTQEIIQNLIDKNAEPKQIFPPKTEQQQKTFENTAPKIQNKTQSKPQTPAVVRKIEQNLNQPSSQNQAVQSQPMTTLNPKVDSAQMARYKNGLRNTMFSHLSLTGIQGEGRCVIEFSVSDSGKLTNRKFYKQSENKSFNDAIYYMMMSVPQFYAPPDDYDGGKIRMEFYINNGYYEISFV